MGLLTGYIERYNLFAMLTHAEYRVYLAIADSNDPHIRCGRIIKDTKFSKLKVSRCLASLKRKGLVLEDKYPHDKRQCNLGLTSEGRDLKLKMLELENSITQHTRKETKYDNKKKGKQLAS